jgi:hypothetical protein
MSYYRGIVIVMTSIIVTLSLQLYIKSHNSAPFATPIVSSTAVLDSIVASQQLTIKILDQENQNLQILVSKYEMALGAVRHTNPELYRQFIRHAQFAEKYTTDHEDEFYKENLKLKTR